MKYVFLNNKFVAEQDAAVSIQDRGFRFGDGIFETIKIHNSRAKDFPLHLLRLEEGLQELKISFDTSSLLDKVEQLIKKNKQAEGFLRIIITRGVGSRGYMPKDDITPTIVIETINTPNMKQQTSSLIVSPYKKIPLTCLPVNYKIMQGLNSSLAKITAKDQGFSDALLTNAKNEICETSSANIFLIRKGKIYTPNLESGVLRGVIREKIINNFKANEEKIKLRQLKKFDLIFITNVALEAKEITLIVNQQTKAIWQSCPKVESVKIFKEIKEFLQKA